MLITLLKTVSNPTQMKKYILICCSRIVAFTAFYACKHEIPVGAIDPTPTPIPGSTGRPCSPDSVYFANQILPMINSGCAMSGCHDNITHKEGVTLTSYATIMRHVVPGNANASKLYTVLLQTGNNRMPPPPNAGFTPVQISLVQKWINQGAKNNACDMCDTADFKYSTAIKPLMQNKCQGCHNPASLGGNIDLSTYAATKAVAVNGKLYGSINWATGFSPMPKGMPKMAACEITQVKKWIDAGSPNN